MNLDFLTLTQHNNRYSENDVGVACFYDKEYENAVKCYVKFAEEEEDEDVDTEYNVFEALNQMTREDSKTYDFARSLYLKHFPGGSYSSKFVRSKSTPKSTPEGVCTISLRAR